MRAYEKIIQLGNFFEKKLLKTAFFQISPEELVKKLKSITDDNYIETVTILANVYRDLQKKLWSFKPTSFQDAVDKYQKINEWENQTYKPYKRALELASFTYSDFPFPNDSGSIMNYIREIVNLDRSYIPDIKDACEEMMHKHHYGGDVYIRFGKYPKSERSRMGLGEEWEKELSMTHEAGVSVFRTKPYRGKWLLIDSNPDKSKYNYRGFDPEAFEYAINAGQIYLVAGEALKQTGADGEVLLKKVWPIKALSPDDIIFSNGVTLTERISSYNNEYFEGYTLPPGKERMLMLGMPYLKIISESGTLPEQIDEILQPIFLNKSNIKDLSEEQVDKIIEYIKNFRNIENKKLVFKGYRPFY